MKIIKLMLCVAILGLVGCPVTPDEIEIATRYCAEQGGIKALQAFLGSTFVTCGNDAGDFVEFIDKELPRDSTE